MNRRFFYFCASLALISITHADEGFTAHLDHEAQEAAESSFEVQAPNTAPVVVNEPVIQAPAPIVVEKSFSPFTGRIKAKKVRMRASADVESKVVKELARHDLLIVTGEKGDFFSVEPPAGTKAYVFRSFVLDGVVEGNRVNVRLEPSLEAPVIAHLNSGDQIKGAISNLNNKWYEIAPPAGAKFYVAKEYIESLGGPEVKVQLDKRKMAAEQLLDSASFLTKSEMQKPFPEISIDRIKHNYETVINEYADFPTLAEKAKENLAALQEDYTQKKIAFLETKASQMGLLETDRQVAGAKVEMSLSPTDRMKLWEPIEESLYLSWSSEHDDRSIDEFYEDQKQSGIVVSGIVENYAAPIKKKPGDFILRDKDLPLAYLYSTHINLQDFVGKKVTIVAAPRNNNNFAFPAYYVLSVE